MRTQGNLGIFVCTSPPSVLDPDGTPDGCTPEHQTLFIPNVTTDVGLSPPFNGLFTIFGQFFDHGLDKITNGGAGTVFVPLKADDPLVTLGPDGIEGNGDEVPPGLRFMTLTRGSIVTGPDGERRRAEHRHAVRRPEPDLHVALVAPVLPPRIRDRRRPSTWPPASSSAVPMATAWPTGSRSRSRRRTCSASS